MPLLYGSTAEAVLAKVPPVPLDKPVVEMTVGEFCRVLNGEEESRLLKGRRALKVLGQLRQLRDEVKSMTSLLDSLSAQPDANEAMALGSVTIKQTPEECLLLEAADAFGLDRLERRHGRKSLLHPAAEDVPLAELIVFRKREAAASQYKRAYHSILSRMEGRK